MRLVFKFLTIFWFLSLENCFLVRLLFKCVLYSKASYDSKNTVLPFCKTLLFESFIHLWWKYLLKFLKFTKIHSNSVSATLEVYLAYMQKYSHTQNKKLESWNMLLFLRLFSIVHFAFSAVVEKSFETFIY